MIRESIVFLNFHDFADILQIENRYFSKCMIANKNTENIINDIEKSL